MSKFNLSDAMFSAGRFAGMAQHGASGLAEKVAEMRAAKVKSAAIGDKRVCPATQRFADGAAQWGLKAGSIANLLSALRFALDNPTVKWDSNLSRMKASIADDGAKDDDETGEKKGKREHTPMPFTERLRRVTNADEYAAFAKFMTEYAHKHPKTFDAGKFIAEYIAANTPDAK